MCGSVTFLSLKNWGFGGVPQQDHRKLSRESNFLCGLAHMEIAHPTHATHYYKTKNHEGLSRRKAKRTLTIRSGFLG